MSWSSVSSPTSVLHRVAEERSAGPRCRARAPVTRAARSRCGSPAPASSGPARVGAVEVDAGDGRVVGVEVVDDDLVRVDVDAVAERREPARRRRRRPGRSPPPPAAGAAAAPARDASSHGCEPSRSRLASCRSSGSSFTMSSASRLPPEGETEAAQPGARPPPPAGRSARRRAARAPARPPRRVQPRRRAVQVAAEQHQVVGLGRQRLAAGRRAGSPAAASRAAISLPARSDLCAARITCSSGHRLGAGPATGSEPSRSRLAMDQVLRAELLDRQHVDVDVHVEAQLPQPGDDLLDRPAGLVGRPQQVWRGCTGLAGSQPRPGAVQVAAE